MTANKRFLLAGAAAVLAGGFGTALAQDASVRGTLNSGSDAVSNFKRDRSVSVRERPHPGYEALGLRAGAFMVWPKLSASIEHNNNIYATSADQVSDTVWHVTPELSAASNWSRHAVQAYARAVINRFSSHSTEDTEDYALGASGRLDVLRTAQLNAGADWSRLTEPRTSATSQGQAFPIQYHVGSAYLSGAREFNRLRVSGRLDWRRFDYLDKLGNPPQDDRDRTMTIATARADYAISPDTALFVQVAGNSRDYRLAISPVVGGAPVFPAFVNRDSKGVEALVGANFEVSAVMRGEVGVGYLKQNFKAANFRDISGFGARSQVEWFPTQLTTVTVTGSRTIEDAGIRGSSGYLSSNIGLQLDHELLRNVILGAQAGYGADDYRGIDRNDKRYTVGVSASYLVNRRVGVTLGYNHFKQSSSGLAGTGDFSVDKVGATVTLQY